MSARKALTKRRARRIARYRAGLILESVLSGGWSPPDLVRRYGQDGVNEIREGLDYYAAWLAATGHPDGTAHR